jgi:hypothetical protein
VKEKHNGSEDREKSTLVSWWGENISRHRGVSLRRVAAEEPIRGRARNRQQEVQREKERGRRLTSEHLATHALPAQVRAIMKKRSTERKIAKEP